MRNVYSRILQPIAILFRVKIICFLPLDRFMLSTLAIVARMYLHMFYF